MLAELEDLAEVASRDVVLVVADWRERERTRQRDTAGVHSERGGTSTTDGSRLPIAQMLRDGVRVVAERGSRRLRAWFEADAVVFVVNESHAAEEEQAPSRHDDEDEADEDEADEADGTRKKREEAEGDNPETDAVCRAEGTRRLHPETRGARSVAAAVTAAIRQVGPRAVFLAVESMPREMPVSGASKASTASWFGAVARDEMDPPSSSEDRAPRVAPDAAAALLRERCGDLLDAAHVLSAAKMHTVPSVLGYDEDDDEDEVGEGEVDRGREAPTGGRGGREGLDADAAVGNDALDGVGVVLGDEDDEGGRTSELSDLGDDIGYDALGRMIDDEDIEGMLASTAASAACVRVDAGERAWVERIGASLRAIIDARARKLLASYAPLRATVRYWSAVAADQVGAADESAGRSGSGTGADVVVAAAERQGRSRRGGYGSATSDGDLPVGVGGAKKTPATKANQSAADKAKAVAANTLGRILVGAVEGRPGVGFVGASELAAGHRRRDPSLSTGWLKYLIYSDSAVSFTGGTLLGLGGPAAAPLTAPPALAMYFTIRLRLCLAIAVLGGKGVLDPWSGVTTLACFFGTDARELLEKKRPTLAQLDDARGAPTPLDAAAAEGDTDRHDADADSDQPRVGASPRPPSERRNLAVRAVMNVRDHVTGAMARVFEAGAAAQNAAIRSAAEAAARAEAHVLARGGAGIDAAAAADRAYAAALPHRMVQAMGEGVFTAANMVVVAAELVPIVSSFLTVRAANAAIRCHLPHLAPAAASALEEAREGAEAAEDACADSAPMDEPGAEGWFSGHRVGGAASAAGEAASRVTGATVTAVAGAGVAIGEATSAATSAAERAWESTAAAVNGAGERLAAARSHWWSRAKAVVVGAKVTGTKPSTEVDAAAEVETSGGEQTGEAPAA